FFQAEDGIRDFHVTGVQTCALPIYLRDQLDELRNPSVPPSPEEAQEEQIREMEDAIREAQEGYEDAAQQVDDMITAQAEAEAERSEERRVGKGSGVRSKA